MASGSHHRCCQRSVTSQPGSVFHKPLLDDSYEHGSFCKNSWPAPLKTYFSSAFRVFLFLESNCLECSCLVWQRCCTCRCRAACEEKISKKIDYAIDSYPGHPADFFSKAMTYQNVMRNSIKKLTKPAAKQKIKDMVSLNPRRPRAKDSTGKYKTKTPGSGYIAIFCFKDVHFKSVRVYCARDSGKPFSKS